MYNIKNDIKYNLFIYIMAYYKQIDNEKYDRQLLDLADILTKNNEMEELVKKIWNI